MVNSGPLMLIGALSLCAPCAAQCFEWHVDVGDAGLDQQFYGGNVSALAVHDVGAGPRLFAGGGFEIGGVHSGVASFDGVSWTSLGNFGGVSAFTFGPVYALCVFDDGAQSQLIAGGQFAFANGTPVGSIAAWNGTAWSALGTGLTGLPRAALALCTFDDGGGPALYVGGAFTHAGGVLANGIARWDGTSWSALGSGVMPNGGIRALCVFDDGSGPALYAAGNFSQISGVAAQNIARFDGTTWSSLGAGLGGFYARCLTTFDDGTGLALYAGGDFTSAGGAPAARVAKWDGATWSALGPGIPNGDVYTLRGWNDGTGPKLFAGGLYTGCVALWDGATWSSMNGGLQMALPPMMPPSALSSLVYDGGSGDHLFIGGDFGFAGGLAADMIVSFGPCLAAGQPYCFGDGSLPTPCPCFAPNFVPNPSGAPDAGCANSFVYTGGKLVGSGRTNPDEVRLLVSNVSASGFGLFIGGDGSDSAGVASGDGVRCAGGAFVRFGGQNALDGNARYPHPRAGWSAPLSQISTVSPGSGAVRHYQFMYRNLALGYCNPSTFNWTNAVSLTW